MKVTHVLRGSDYPNQNESSCEKTLVIVPVSGASMVKLPNFLSLSLDNCDLTDGDYYCLLFPAISFLAVRFYFAARKYPTVVRYLSTHISYICTLQRSSTLVTLSLEGKLHIPNCTHSSTTHCRWGQIVSSGYWVTKKFVVIKNETRQFRDKSSNLLPRFELPLLPV